MNKVAVRGFKNKIEEHMTEYPRFASRKTPVGEAVEFMRQMGFRHLPVVENGKVVGIVSNRDLKQADLMGKTLNLTLQDVMSMEPYCVQVGTRLSEVANEMADRRIGSAVVLDEDHQVVGIFTATDGMRILGEVLSTVPLQVGFDKSIEDFLSGNVLI